MSTFLADSLRDIRRLCDHARVIVLFIHINWWSLTIFYIKMLELSSSFDTGLCKIPVDLDSTVRILETSAFFSTFSMFMLG